jgi:transglutaminase-like putative cysteine protease
MRALFCLIVSLLCMHLQAQKILDIANIPAELLLDSMPVVRYDKATMYIKSIEASEIEVAYAITFFKPPSRNFTQLVLTEREGAINYENIEAAIYDAKGRKVKSSGKSDLVERKESARSIYEFTDDRVKTLEMNYHTYPYTLTYSYKQINKNAYFLPRLTIQDLGYSVQECTYKIIYPHTLKFKYEVKGTDIKPVESFDEKTKTWEISVANLRAIGLESFSSYAFNKIAFVKFYPEDILYHGVSGKMTDWKSFGMIFYNLNKDQDIVTPAIQAKVDELTAGLNDNKSKIKVLYKYLQDNFRYISIQIGIGGWKTFPSDWVDSKKYGDCKALSNYMKTLLKAANIQSHLCLVYANLAGSPELHSEWPNDIFNHMILYVPDQDMFLECTSSNDPPGYIGGFTGNRQALVLFPDGGKLLTTPSYFGSKSAENYSVVIKLAETGHADVQLNAQYRGLEQDNWRGRYQQLSAADFQDSFYKSLPFTWNKVQDFKAQASDDQPEFDIQVLGSINQFAVKTGARLFIPVNKFHPVTLPFPLTNTRKLDLDIKQTVNALDSIVIQLPDGYNLESAPADINYKDDFMSYTRTVKQDGRSITIYRHVFTQALLIKPEQYTAFKAQVKKMDEWEAAKLVVVKKP